MVTRAWFRPIKSQMHINAMLQRTKKIYITIFISSLSFQNLVSQFVSKTLICDKSVWFSGEFTYLKKYPQIDENEIRDFE